jgi:hypothetical protein
MSDDVQSTSTNAPPAPPTQLTDEEQRAWLDYEFGPLAERVGAIIAAISQNVEAYPSIDSDEILGKFAENVAMAKAAHKTATDNHDAAKADYLRLGRVVDRWLREAVTDPLRTPLATVQTMMDTYTREKLRIAREAAAAAAKLAEEEAARTAKAAADAIARANTVAKQVAAEKATSIAEASALEAAEAMARANAKPADLTRVRGEFDATASLRGTWRWRATNLRFVPVELLLVNNAAVTERIRVAGRDADGKPKARIPGIEIYFDTKTVVTAR